MALEPSAAIDMNELQFPLRNKSQLFVGESDPNGKYHLLAAASLYGLIIAGSNKPELRVFQLSSVVDKLADAIPVRTIPLNQAPKLIAVSCDHSMLAVNYDHNGSSFISVYSVLSFMSNNVFLLYQNIVLSPELNVVATELLWNPVIPSTLAVTLSNGSLSVFNFNGQGYELHLIDKAEEVRCASWSPKGKQIVVGFPNGKLAQYKPDLKLARTIPCQQNIFNGPFDVITVQWLSTYQFAAAFLRRGPGECPAIFIVNAPKNVQPTYINYDDICYSQSGPRPAQVFLEHILPWNIILVASANSMEVGVMGTRETGETPTWSQYFIDGMRPEIPLTADKMETYPLGFAIDTGCSHRITMNEVQLDVMPMMHILANNGLLVSFDVVNKMAGIPTLCQAPKTLNDTSGLHMFVKESISAAPPVEPTVNTTSAEVSFSVPPSAATSTPTVAPKAKPSIFAGEIKPTGTGLFGSIEPSKAIPNGSMFSGQTTIQSIPPSSKPTTTGPPASDPNSKLSFGAPPAFGGSSLFGGQKSSTGSTPNTSIPFGASSTPSVGFGTMNNPTSVFGAASAATPTISFGSPPTPAVAFGASSTPPIAFGSPSTGSNPAFGSISQPASAASKPTLTAAVPKKSMNNESQAFLTVSSNYTQQSSDTTQQSTSKSFGSDDNKVIRKMIAEEIASFESEWNAVLTRSRQLNISIGTKDEMAAASKELSELQDISGQATESTDALSMEIQSLLMLMNETFAMVTEAKAKRTMFSNMDVSTLRDTSSMSQTSRRQMEKLQRLLATNETQYQIVNKQIDAYWSSHQQHVKQNKKALMHIPQMENVYMTLTKQRQILKSNAQKLAYIKSKIGYRDLSGGATAPSSHTPRKLDVSVNSLSDSIFSMSLCDQVKLETEKLSTVKMNALREFLRTRQTITVITPKRPDRKGLSSEVVLERKIAQDKLAKKATLRPAERQATSPSQGNFEPTKNAATIKTTQQPQHKPVANSAPPTADGFFSSNAPAQSAIGPTTNAVASKASISNKQANTASATVSAVKPFAPSSGFGSFKAADTPGFGVSKTSDTPAFGDFKASDSSAYSGFKTSESPAFGAFKTSETPVFGGLKTSEAPAFGGFKTSDAPAFGGFKTSDAPAFGGFKTSDAPAFGGFKTSETTPAFGGFKSPETPGTPAISFGGSSKPVTPYIPSSIAPTSAPQSNQSNPIVPVSKPTSTQPFGGVFTSNAPNLFGSSSLFSGSAPPASNAGAPPAFTFSVANAPAFGTTATKPLTPTLNALLPKGIAAAAEAKSGSASSTTVPTATAKPIEADKENRPKAVPSAHNKNTNIPAEPFGSAAIKPTTVPTSNGPAVLSSISKLNPTGAVSSTSPTAITTSNTTTNATSPELITKSLPPSTTAVLTTAANQGFVFSLAGGATPATQAPSVSTPSQSVPTPSQSVLAEKKPTTGQAASIAGTDNLFQGLTVCKPEAANSSSNAPAPATNIFATSVFGAPKSGDTPTTTASIFGAPATATTNQQLGSNVFATSVSNPPSTNTAASPFAAFVAENPGPPPAGTSIFGGAAAGVTLPKPEQSVFGGGSSVFGTTAANIFGGGSATAAPAFAATTSPFGAPAASVATSSSTTSIFGQSSFSQQQPSNVFGQPAAAAVSSATSIFGSPSVFGGGAPAAASPSSIFGGGSSTLAPSAFGTSTFGSAPAAAAPSAFGQTSSVFGSPAQNSSSGGSMFGSGFGSPSGGAPGTFGAPPAFGAAPAFGGAPTFGSPKGAFGSTFGQSAASPPTFATQVTQKNSLFESLGSSETGMTFGNIAQNTTTSTPNTFSGGSSFTSWR